MRGSKMEPAATTLTVEPETRRREDWADPGYFYKRASRAENVRRLLMSLVMPPDTPTTAPTTAGWVLIMLSMGIGMAAYNTSSNILFMTLAILLSSLILSGVLSVLNFRGLQWRMHLPVHFRAGEPARLQIEVENHKKVLPTYSIGFRPKADSERELDPVFLESRLEPGGRAMLDWLFTPERRGLARVEVSGVESQYPFGFLRKTMGGRMRREVRVWPARVEYTAQWPAGKSLHQQGSLLRRSGTGADLLGLRDYRAGDPPRAMHWKASARAGRLLVRELADEMHSGFILHVETDAAMWKGREGFEAMCAVAGTLAEDFFRENRLLGVAFDDQPLHPVKRISDLHRFLDRLAVLEPGRAGTGEKREPLGRYVVRFRPVGKEGVTLHLGGNEIGTFKS